MTDPTWTILIPTLGQRTELFQRLMACLLPQLDEFGGRARVVAYYNNGTPPLPEVRQRLIEAVQTDYLCFVDDDDLVEPDYVAAIMGALESRPEYVGFNLRCYTDGIPGALSHHTLRARRWYEDKVTGELYRDVTHLNPMLATIARKATFRRCMPGRAEDRIWAGQLRGKLHKEVLIDRVLYHYLWSPKITAWANPQTIGEGEPRVIVDHPHFLWHPRCEA